MANQEERMRLAVMRLPVIRTVAEVERAAIAWKEEQAEWKSLVKHVQR